MVFRSPSSSLPPAAQIDAPSPANRQARAAPIPAEPPVTIALWPSSALPVIGWLPEVDSLLAVSIECARRRNFHWKYRGIGAGRQSESAGNLDAGGGDESGQGSSVRPFSSQGGGGGGGPGAGAGGAPPARESRCGEPRRPDH